MIVNQSRNDSETNARASVHMTKTLRIDLIVCGAILATVFSTILLVEILLRPEYVNYFYYVLFLVLGVVLLFLGIFFNKFLKATSKRMMRDKESTVTFTFSYEGYRAETLFNDGTTETLQGNYESFTKCREYADMWLLYLNRANVFILEKDGMKEGTAEDLSSLFREKCGLNYKLCYRINN